MISSTKKQKKSQNRLVIPAQPHRLVIPAKQHRLVITAKPHRLVITAKQVHVVSYDSEKHQLNCRFPDGIVREVDPFVGCAIECTDDDYVEKGEACVGKDFIMSGSWRHGPYLCHRFDEIPAPPHTEERG